MFIKNVDNFFEDLSRALEPLKKVDYDETPGTFLIRLPDGKVYLFNIYKPSEQLWMASPFSGGRHFTYEDGFWKDTRNQENVWQVLGGELNHHYGLTLAPAPSLLDFSEI